MTHARRRKKYKASLREVGVWLELLIQGVPVLAINPEGEVMRYLLSEHDVKALKQTGLAVGVITSRLVDRVLEVGEGEVW